MGLYSYTCYYYNSSLSNQHRYTRNSSTDNIILELLFVLGGSFFFVTGKTSEGSPAIRNTKCRYPTVGVTFV